MRSSGNMAGNCTSNFYTGKVEEMADRAAALIIAEACQAVAEHGRCSMALAGGNSPRHLYKRLEALPPNTWLFMGDERAVPLNHPDSNYRMIRDTLLQHSEVSEAHLFRMAAGDGDIEKSATEYEAAMRSFFLSPEQNAPDEFPVFDLMLLGLGDDGHTASLFANNPQILQEKKRWVVPVNALQGKPPGMRLTLTLPVINHARTILFFITGKGKSKLAERIFLEQERGVPAALVKPENGKIFWFIAQP